ncbi:hypothetical protein HMPREF3038_00271 [Akkermansia sp. KLE1797]|nr:hypothetical protein HMPREF3038_00271 [Akkermansia sp. KLE1797]KZA04393.1 hypothetical protein HMPREF1326_01903 [Akkermansia sp. KLE1605]
MIDSFLPPFQLQFRPRSMKNRLPAGFRGRGMNPAARVGPVAGSLPGPLFPPPPPCL